ncbi:hypothetical protein V5O48_013841 [Marasmius crinis-equi]|uniref:Uncharacterized protein n=1 Tax=Marasmius crinis-equi TaxID=585013 RepID=A0ABR3EYY8_9AGAR
MAPRRSTRTNARTKTKTKTAAPKTSDMVVCATASNLGGGSLKRKSAEETLIDGKQVKKKKEADVAQLDALANGNDNSCTIEDLVDNEAITAPTSAATTTDPSARTTSVAAFTGGAFDIYPMVLPQLNDITTQTKPGTPVDYTALYAKIIELQEDHSNSGKLSIYFPPGSDSIGCGRLRCHLPCFVQPMWNEPLDIGIEGVARHANLELDVGEKTRLRNGGDDAVPSGEGITGSLLLVRGMVGVDGLGGSLKLFTTPVSDGLRLYRGVLSSEVAFGHLLYVNGYAKDANECTFSFWLVPSKENASLECRHLEDELADIRFLGDDAF